MLLDIDTILKSGQKPLLRWKSDYGTFLALNHLNAKNILNRTNMLLNLFDDMQTGQPGKSPNENLPEEEKGKESESA